MTGDFTDVDKILASEMGRNDASKPSLNATQKYRPSVRPAMALLDVFDDGQRDAERIRIRQDVTTVGRQGSDVCIPHDAAIADLHLKIVREAVGARWRWSLVAEPMCKLFVRARRTRLRQGSEFLAGSNQFQFRAGMKASAASKDELAARLVRGSIPGASLDTSLDCASIIALTGSKKDRPLWLLGAEFWIGRAPDCSLCLADDPFLAQHHVRLAKQESGEWQALTNKVPNGLWIRVESISVQSTCTFQIGEQRMRFSVC